MRKWLEIWPYKKRSLNQMMYLVFWIVINKSIKFRFIRTFFSLSDATFIGQYIAFKLMCGSLRKVRENYPERLCEEFSSSKGKRFKYKMHNTSMICITSWKIRFMLFPLPSKNMYSFMTSPKFPTKIIEARIDKTAIS